MGAARPDRPAAIDAALLDYLLRLGDSDLVLAQRLGERIGHAPILEEDIALTNVGLDLLGQARLWYAYAGEVEARLCGVGRDEDTFALRRDEREYRSLLLLEQPNGTFAEITVRGLYFDLAHELSLTALCGSCDARIAEIAAKARKEVLYHVGRSIDWTVRLGDGTTDSRRRMQDAIDALWTYTGEMFEDDAIDSALAAAGIVVPAGSLRAPWRERLAAVLAQATLEIPAGEWFQRGGRQGRHTEHLGHLLAEMQWLQRAYPGAQW